MTATKPLGSYGNGVGTVTPLDHKMATAGLLCKTTTPGLIRPGFFYEGVSALVTGKANMSYDVLVERSATTRGASFGALLGANDGVVNVATTAAPGANSRYDVVYKWHREFALDGVDSNPVIGVVQGTAASVPTVPSLAAFPGAIEMARILVPSGVTATSSGTTITQTAPFTSVDGGRVRFRTQTEMDAWTTALPNQEAVDLSTGAIYKRVGSAWLPIATFCALRKSGNQSLTTTLTPVVWDVELADASGMHDNVTNNTRITAPVAGLYEFSVQGYNNNTTGTGVIQARQNGTTDVPGSFTRRDGTGTAAIPLTVVFPAVLAAGDYVEIMVSHSTTAGTLSGGTSAGSAVLTAKYIGPA
jgi:hypothetical protein